jgi:cobalt-precorrin-6B (C15)-methyltransferase
MEEPPGGRTKDEIRAIALFKLGLDRNDTFADLGCGAGTVAIEASRVVKTVHAVDISPRTIAFATQAAELRGCRNIRFYTDDAAQFLRGLNELDVAFVGGSKSLRAVIDELARLAVRKVVVSAVLLRTVHEAVGAMRDAGIFEDVVLVQVSRSQPLAGDIMFRPLDPVYLITGGARKC